jgi:hypothetical protein
MHNLTQSFRIIIINKIINALFYIEKDGIYSIKSQVRVLGS